jgi:hypothetical protein
MRLQRWVQTDELLHGLGHIFCLKLDLAVSVCVRAQRRWNA